MLDESAQWRSRNLWKESCEQSEQENSKLKEQIAEMTQSIDTWAEERNKWMEVALQRQERNQEYLTALKRIRDSDIQPGETWHSIWMKCVHIAGKAIDGVPFE